MIYFLTMHCFYVLIIAEQPIAFIAGGFFDNVEVQQVVQHFADGGVGQACQLFQLGNVGYRMTEQNQCRKIRCSASQKTFITTLKNHSLNIIVFYCLKMTVSYSS